MILWIVCSRKENWNNEGYFTGGCKISRKERSAGRCQRRLCKKLYPFQKAHEDKLAAERLAEAKAFAEDLKKVEVTLSIKTGEGGKLFGSISSKEIAQAAKEQLNLDIDKKKLVLPNPIKAVGTTLVPIKLHPQVTGELKVVVREA